jgi:hypothetical protein
VEYQGDQVFLNLVREVGEPGTEKTVRSAYSYRYQTNAVFSGTISTFTSEK